ncbi:arginine/ornithine antiporter ArcD [Halolamina pelagica]|uniref:Arginine/ornithine antiporter ArcD n=1 Tax=Halolamina pelagica TaxID=699431 RepID=A0A0P7FXP2_9EURY|nr:Na+/H+ antiporter NhaC family protein [Halolamina pelagica]KPN32007.1 arginine/ornithine antiporter ArcD [Halolamina pelagica]
MSTEFGVLSIVPPLLAIVLAITTRKAVLSLFIGIWAGAVIFTGGLGVVQTFEWIVVAVAGEFHVRILVFTLLLGSGVAMVWNLGGSNAVRDWAIERLDSQRKAGAVAWGLGVVLFFDDYANTAIVGSAMKDVSDHLRISREKLSYIVDSTAAPVATLGISSWVAFQLSLISDGYEAAGVADHPPAFEVFLNSIPFNMYSILAIVMVAIIVATGRDYGEMLDAEHRSWHTGQVSREDARPMQDVESDLGEPNAENARLVNFFVPIAVLIAVTVASALWTGYSPGASLMDMVTNADFASALIYGSFAMVATGFVLGKLYGILTLGEATDTTIDGFGLMLTAVSILVLAWGIGEVVSALGTGEYVAGVVGDSFPVAVLPALVLVLAAFIAFSTGTSWGTMGILTPIVIPVAWNLTGDHTIIAAAVGVIFSGAIFGDHSSPISDTTVLSATFTGADLIDHVRTQLYYAVTVATVAVALLLVWGVTRISPLLLLPVGVVLIVGLVYALSEFDASRKGLEPVVADAPPEGSEPADD